MTKLRRIAAVSIASTVALGVANVPMVFANENKVNISDFKIEFDGVGRVLFDFTIDKDIDLGLFSKDNIELNIRTNDGIFKKTKGKTWDGYLNAEDGTKYGSKNTKLPAGRYTSVFSESALNGVALEDLTAEVKVTKNSEISKVTIPKQEDEIFEIKSFEVGTNAPDQALVTFEINQTMDLGLTSQDNIKIEAINPYTGQAMTVKNKTWNGYLNDANGNKYGLGSVLKPGVYTTVFNTSQIEYLNPADVVIKFTAVQDGVEYTKQRGEVSIKNIDPVQVTDLKLEAIENGEAIFTFTIDQVLNLKLNTKDNLMVKVIEKSTGDVLTVKDKTWANYLNNSKGEQFGRGEVVNAGTYSTKLTSAQLRGKNIEDLAIEVVAIQDDVQTRIATDNYMLVTPVKIDNVLTAQNGEGIHVEFDIDQDLSLKLNSKDNLIIEAINKNTGDVLKKKDKTWTDYLNDKNGNQFGLNELVVAGNYATTFSKEQLKGTSIDDVVFRITAIQEEINTSVTTGEFVQKEGVNIDKLEATQEEDKSITVGFTVDKEIDLALLKDSLTIELVDKVSGNTVTSKNKFDSAYIVDEDGNEYGFGDKIPAGRYTVRFSAEEVGELKLEDAQVIVSIIKDGVHSAESTDKVEFPEEDIMPEVDNIFGGSTRYETSVDVSVNGWETSDDVVLVSGTAIIDGIAATPFAGLKDAPILLTEGNKIPDCVKEEIQRLGAKNVYIVGGDSVVSAQVEAQLKDMELSVERLAGKTRYETSLQIAKAMEEITDVKKAFVVGGEGAADGLSIGAVAGIDNQEAPIVLVDKNNVPLETSNWLKENVEYIDIIGGDAVVSDEVEAELSKIVEKDNVSRVAGKTRQETNAEIMNKYYEGFDSVIVVKADNTGMVDGLTAGALAAKYQSPIVMVYDTLHASQEEVLVKDGEAQVYQAGYGVNKNVFNKIMDILTKK